MGQGGVAGNVPVQMLRQIRHLDLLVFPKGVDAQEYHIVRSGFRMLAGKENANDPGIRVTVCMPGKCIVNADGGEVGACRFQIFCNAGVCLSQSDHIPAEPEDLLIFLQQGPVQPGYFVVLTVGIVVAELGVAEFISRKEHGCAPAAQQGGKGIFDKPHAQCPDLLIVRVSLGAAVPAVSTVVPVRIVPAVGFVVFGVVGVQIIQGKAIVTGEKIDGGIVPPVYRVVQIRRAGDPVDGCLRHARISL